MTQYKINAQDSETSSQYASIRQKGLVKYHSVFTAVMLGLIMVALIISSLGIVIKHPYVIYFWYMGLFGIAMVLTTSMLVAVALVLSRIFKPRAIWDERWLSMPKSIRT
jgi:lysylphosphatidylglycerol synthetase-like protein (DUF2156 family)